MSELLEYIVSLRGGDVTAAELKGVRDGFLEVGAAAKEAARAGVSSGAASEAAGASHGNAAAAAGGMGAAMAKMAKVGAVGLVGLGIVATKMSTTFNHEMLRIQTETGGTSKELNRMKSAVLNLASSGQSFGQGPTALAAGLYHLESLGMRGSKAIMALKLASQEAAISGANLEDTTSALGSVLYVGIKGAGGLKNIMESLNATVGSGNMRMQQLVEAMGTGVLSAAKVAGLSFQDVTAALAVFSDSGQNASSAAAQFATSLHYLYAPTAKAQEALAGIHLGANALALDMRKPNGMIVALGDLRDHLKGLSQVNAARVLNAILPGGRGRILLTELEMMNRAIGKYGQQSHIKTEFSTSVTAQGNDPVTKMAIATARLQATMIKLGDGVQKYVVPSMLALFNVVGKLLLDLLGVFQWFTKMSPAAQALAVFVGVLAGGFLTLAAALKLAALAQGILDAMFVDNPIGLVITALAVLGAGFVYAYDKSTTFRKIVQGVFGWLKTAVLDVVGFIGKHWKMLVLALPFVGLAAFVVAHFGAVKNVVVGILNWIIARINDVTGAINSIDAVSVLGNRIGAPKIPKVGLIGTGMSGTTSSLKGNTSRGQTTRMLSGGGTAHVFTAPTPAASHKPKMEKDVVVQVGRDSIARIHKRDLYKAMMG